MNAITRNRATAGQIKQINRFGSDAIKKVLTELGLNKYSAQRIIEHGNEFNETIRNSLKDLSGSSTYISEEVESRNGYFSNYKPKSITEQTNILRQLFPGVGYANEKIIEQPRPVGAEGWFAIPKWQTLAPTYKEALERVFMKLSEVHGGKFKNPHKGNCNLECIHQIAETADAFEKLRQSQEDHDILVIPAQFGLRYRGCSVRRARELMNKNEFGLDAFAVGIMLLTHLPERLMYYADLCIDCAGDECPPGPNNAYVASALSFSHEDGILFDCRWTMDASHRYGSASAFFVK